MIFITKAIIMSKKYIQVLVKESLSTLLEKSKKSKVSPSKEEKKEKDSEENDKEDKEDKEEKVEYQDVQNFWKDGKHKSVTKVGVFRDAGFSEKEIYNREPYKKLDMEKNEMGGVYRFSKDELDRIRTELDKYPRGA